MFLDHLSYALPSRQTWLNFLGRIAFPLFAFQLTEGYTHTRDFNKYALRLAIFAILSQYPFSLLMRMTGGSQATLNIFFTLLIGLLAIRAYDVLPCKVAVAAGVLIASEVATLIHTDYGQWGVLLIFALYITRENRFSQGCAMLLMVLLRYGFDILNTGVFNWFALGVMLSYIFILLYNGERGIKVKYLLYAFYPLHIFLLYLIHQIIA